MKIKLVHTYQDIISLENLLLAWDEFIIGKKSKPDVQEFSRNLMDHIVTLNTELVNKTYYHGGYHAFYITDPKRRHIHKASVRDRLVHHAIYRILYSFFDRTFISDSYSCRKQKGVHKALQRFNAFAHKESKNHTRTCWVLKCDIKQFFASIDHDILFSLVKEYIPDEDILSLLKNIIDSYKTEDKKGTGLPLGNLTSQLLTNIYMNHFDQWVKHTLKVKYYIRYADDFVFFSHDKTYLEQTLTLVDKFLSEELRLILHPKKIFLKTIASGINFLGWVHFSNHRIIRTVTKRRMFNRIKQQPTEETLQSYVGLLKHGNGKKIEEQMVSLHWLYSDEC